jgi:hypothetical protein
VGVVVIKVVCAASFDGQVRLRVLSWYPSASTVPQTKVSDPPVPSHWRAQVQVVSKPARGILLDDAGLSKCTEQVLRTSYANVRITGWVVPGTICTGTSI